MCFIALSCALNNHLVTKPFGSKRMEDKKTKKKKTHTQLAFNCTYGFHFFISVSIHIRKREQQCLTFPMVSMATENGVRISSTFNKFLFGISAQKAKH